MGKTSTQVKQKYLNKTYSQIAIRLPKELVAQWEEKLEILLALCYNNINEGGEQKWTTQTKKG